MALEGMVWHGMHLCICMKASMHVGICMVRCSCCFLSVVFLELSPFHAALPRFSGLWLFDEWAAAMAGLPAPFGAASWFKAKGAQGIAKGLRSGNGFGLKPAFCLLRWRPE